MQHAPDIDVLRKLDVEDEIGIPGQRPRPQSRQIELVRVPWRSRRGMAADVGVGTLQRIYEAQSCVRCALTHVMRDGLVDIPAGLLARDDDLDLQSRVPALVPLRTWFRRPSK